MTGIVQMLNRALVGSYVNNVYSVDENTILFKLRNPPEPEHRLLLSNGNGISLTRYDLHESNSTTFVHALRRHLLRAKIVSVEQPGTERVVALNLSQHESGYRLIAEFFGGGNIILVDANEKIIVLLKKLVMRHRTLRIGGQYQLPPSRGSNPHLSNSLPSMTNSDLTLGRWLGRTFSFPHKYVLEILTRAELEEELPCAQINEKMTLKLNSAFQWVMDASTQAAEPTLVFADGSLIDIWPFKPLSIDETLTKKADGILEAVDELLTHDVLVGRKTGRNEAKEKKLGELDKALGEQTDTEKKLATQAEELRNAARKLTECATTNPDPRVEMVMTLIEEILPVTINQAKRSLEIEIGIDPIDASIDAPIMTLVSRLFGGAKMIDKKIVAIGIAKEKLQLQRDEVQNGILRDDSRQVIPSKVRAKKWFERYRWFKTSEELLAIGGRDANSNTTLLSRYVADDDIVFHADIQGSPFYVLKGGKHAGENSILETAQATVSFSSVWKSGLGGANAYWVEPWQLSKTPPSGLYLPRGSFIVSGKKNYLKGIAVETGVGLVTIDDEVVMTGGPVPSVMKSCMAYVVLIPGNEKSSDVAKRIKTELVRLAPSKLVPTLKRLPLDEIILVMPPGGVKIVSSGRGAAPAPTSDEPIGAIEKDPDHLGQG